jgi:hypothetical protein
MDTQQHLDSLITTTKNLLPDVEKIVAQTIDESTVIDGQAYIRSGLDVASAHQALDDFAEATHADAIFSELDTVEFPIPAPLPKPYESDAYSNDEIARAVEQIIEAGSTTPEYGAVDLANLEDVCPAPEPDPVYFLPEEEIAAFCEVEVIPNIPAPDKTKLVLPDLADTDISPSDVIEGPELDINLDALDDIARLELLMNMFDDMKIIEDNTIGDDPLGIFKDIPKTKCVEIIAEISQSVGQTANELVKNVEKLGELQARERYLDIIQEYYRTRYEHYTLFAGEAQEVAREELRLEGIIRSFTKNFRGLPGMTEEQIEMALLGSPQFIEFKKQFDGIRSRSTQLKASASRDITMHDPDQFQNNLRSTIEWFSNELRVRGDGYDSTLDIEKIESIDNLSGRIKDNFESLKNLGKLVTESSIDPEEESERLRDQLDADKNATKFNVGQLGREASFSKLVVLLDTGDLGEWSNVYRDASTRASGDLDGVRREIEVIEKAGRDIKEQLEGTEQRMLEALDAHNCRTDGTGGSTADPNDPNTQAVPEAGSNIEYKGPPNPLATSPPLTDRKWWDKFSLLATTVNLIPAFWPIGLIIPSPGGPIPIPFPIIWKSLVVMPVPASMNVVFLTQCGVLPTPTVFTLNPAPVPLGPVDPGSGWFTACIRPMGRIKGDVGSKVIPAIPMVESAGQKINADPEFTKKLPLLQDDLPAWERLSLTNPAFMIFLLQWCLKGKSNAAGFLP